MSGQSALAVLRAESHVSVSAINTYLRCPAQFEHRYVLNTPASHRPAALSFGSAIHVALARFYAELMHDHPEPTAEDLVASFSDAWTRELASSTPVLFDRDHSGDSLRDKGVELVQLFHSQAPRPQRVLGVEEAFSIELCDPTTGEVFDERLVGAIDAIAEDEHGLHHLLEHKTGARKRGFDGDLQGIAYATVVAPAIGLGKNTTVTYQLLIKTKTPQLVVEDLHFTGADRRDFLRTVIGVLAAIRAGAFYPRHDQAWVCQGCPFAGPCLAG